MRDLNKLSKEIYRANKAKGFHEESHSVEHMLCLVISELMEAVEADRKGNRVDYKCEEDGLAYTIMEDEEFKEWYECTTKGSVEEALADAIIRLLDTAGALGVTISAPSDGFVYQPCFGLFTENIYDIISSLFGYIPSFAISASIVQIEGVCSKLDIDIWSQVDMKLRYNSLRPYKHGKAY